jgi:Tfp pilus assembly protein PilF
MPRRFLLSFIIPFAALALAHGKPENWLEIRSPHFTVISNGSEKQARHVADQLERMRAVFHMVFPHQEVDPSSPIIVLAIKDERDFRALEPAAYLARGQLNLAGLFLRAPDKNYILLRLDAQGEHPYATVYHEYTHLLLSKADYLPVWLNEGLAEFYQNTDIDAKGARLGQPSAVNILLLRQNRLLPLPTLFAVDHNSPYYHEETKGNIFYAESWALTHYLMVKDYKENKQLVLKYARAVSDHEDPVAAAAQVFGDLKQLQSVLDRYVSQSSFNEFTKPGSIDLDDSTFNVQRLTQVQADAFRADFLAYNNRIAESRALLTEVLRDDPGNALAHETMGYLAFSEGHLDEARKWYEQAVKLDSQSFLAHYYFAAISMKEGSLTPEGEAQVERSLRTAIKLNPSFAPSYDELAVFYGMRRKNLEEAHSLSLTAVQLDPGNVSYRMNTANILIQMQRPKDAIAVLQNALKLAKSPQEAASIQDLLLSTERYEAMEEAQHGADRDSEPSEVEPVAAGGENRNQTSTAGRSDVVLRGPRHTINGKLKNVQCSNPAILQLQLETPVSSLTLRSDNYFKIQYSALNFTPTGDLKPCTDLEGMKASVEYFEVVGKPAEGQIISIQLTR